jgi:hypothetical protein
MVLVDVDGHMSASVRYIEKKAIEKSTALDLAREIIGDQPRHIPLFQLAAEICKRARDESFSEDGSAPPGLAFRDFYISDLTLGKMKEDLKSIGWQDIEKPRKPRSRGRSNNSADSPAEIRPAADERKRPTVATSLDPGLSRLPRGSN